MDLFRKLVFASLMVAMTALTTSTLTGCDAFEDAGDEIEDAVD